MKFGIIIAAGVLALGASAFAQLNRGTGAANTTYTQVYGGPSTWSGIYNVTSGWALQTATGPQNISVSADVELWGQTTLDNSYIYFHKANDQNPGAATLNGTLYSNRGMWVGVQGPNKNGQPALLNKLIQTTDYALNPIAHNPATDVPLVWEGRFTADNGATWTQFHPYEAYGPGADNTIQNAYWWRMGDDSRAGGYFNYQFRCTPTFAPLQTAGRYELDPILVIAPEL